MDYSKLVEEYLVINKEKNIKLKIDDLVDNHSSFDEFSNEASKRSINMFKKEKSLIEMQILSLTSLSIYLADDVPENRVLRTDFSAKDSHLCSFLINICNTANATLKLSMMGFIPQAHSLLRTLLERTMQGVVLFSNSEDYSIWQKGQDPNDSKASHYVLFSKRERLLKKLEKIEIDLFGKENENGLLRNYRKETNDYYSMSVHGASIPVLVGSWAFQNSGTEDEIMKPAFFGASCDSAGKVLGQVIFTLQPFIDTFYALLEKNHLWKNNFDNDLLTHFEFYYFASKTTFLKLVEEEYQQVET
ncbi:DUF5677 domain-containing protein [Psychromonas arctica]|uniref:DUF5677 domain-containing protein n=1 Tax=Psychromonas arctica TaxID=168275 RepID=UPI002FD514EC